MAKAVEPDEQLMAQVARDQREPLAVLLRRYGSPLLTFIQRMIGDRHRSEELFQEVFLAVWISRRQYAFPRPFRAWLFGIALNKCRGEFRNARPSAVSFDEQRQLGATPQPAGPDDAAIAVETAAIVQTAVMRLPEQQRQAVVLRVWNGLSYAEIADIMQRAESTVRSDMFHGLAALRKYLEPRLR
jgi:RNA polymerase sigma-70 factor (ECF subfamily)